MNQELRATCAACYQNFLLQGEPTDLQTCPSCGFSGYVKFPPIPESVKMVPIPDIRATGTVRDAEGNIIHG